MCKENSDCADTFPKVIAVMLYRFNCDCENENITILNNKVVCADCKLDVEGFKIL